MSSSKAVSSRKNCHQDDDAKTKELIARLRHDLSDWLPADLDTDCNLFRWVHGLRGDLKEAGSRLRLYAENRRLAKLDDPEFLTGFFRHPLVKRYVPYFSFSLAPSVINQIDNTVVIVQRFEGVDFQGLTRVMTCSQFLLLYFCCCEWFLRQVLQREAETGRQSGLTIIYDLENFQLLDYVNPNAAVHKIFRLCLGLLQDYYCDMLHHLLIVNAPSMLGIVLEIVKKFLNPATQQKFLVVPNTQTLFGLVHPSAIPVSLGGSWRAKTEHAGFPVDHNNCSIVPRPVVEQDFLNPKIYCNNVEMIKQKSLFEVERTVRKPNSKIVYQFRVNGDVQFCVVRLLADGKRVLLTPCWTLTTPKLPEEGSVLCAEPGDYFLEFVNLSNSWFNLKLEYYVAVEESD